MNVLSALLVAVVAAGTLSAVPSTASAQDARSGPGMMHCKVVMTRLSSADAADRMPVLSWAQGYLSGIASVASAFDGSSDVQVPSYDELRPRITAICKKDPSLDLYHVARYISSRRDG